MLNYPANLAMSTSVLKVLPGKLDIKIHLPSILYISASLTMSTSVLKDLPSKLDIKGHSLDWKQSKQLKCAFTQSNTSY